MKILIGSQEYKVEYKDRLVNGGVEVLGFIDYDKGKININTDITGTQLDNTILHECLHGMLHEVQREENKDEILVQLLSNQLQMFLKNNKDLVLSLMKDEVE